MLDKKLAFFSIVIIGTVLISGCVTQSKQIDDDHTDDIEATGEIKEFEIIAKSWEFVPNTIEVNLGDKVELHIESIDITHGFRLSKFGINERLEPNQDVHVDFIADKRGAFSFSCSVSCGAGHGNMAGQLIVK